MGRVTSVWWDGPNAVIDGETGILLQPGRNEIADPTDAKALIERGTCFASEAACKKAKKTADE